MWKPDIGDDYCYIDLDAMTVDNIFWCNRKIDNLHYNHKVIFKTEEEAEEYLEYLNAKEKAMNEFSKEEWEDDSIYKYCFYYDYPSDKIEIAHYLNIKDLGEPYFRTKEKIQEFIDKFDKCIRRELGV